MLNQPQRDFREQLAEAELLVQAEELYGVAVIQLEQAERLGLSSIGEFDGEWTVPLREQPGYQDFRRRLDAQRPAGGS